MSMGEEVEDEFSFNVPQNFTPPEDYEEGKPFDMVASLVMKNGRLQIQALNGAKLAAEEAEVEDEESASDDEETDTEEETAMVEDGGATLMKSLESLRA